MSVTPPTTTTCPPDDTPAAEPAPQPAPWKPISLDRVAEIAPAAAATGGQSERPALPPRLDVATMFGREPESYDWVLPGLPAGRVGMLAATGGAGKSWMALQWLVALAGGWNAPWPDDLLPGPQRPPAHVLYVTAEETAQDLHHRLWALGRNLDVGQRSTVAEHLDIHPTVGLRLLSCGGPGPLVGALTDALAPGRYALVVLDPLARLSAIDENDNREATELVDAVDGIARTSGAAVVMLHHVGKAALRAGDGDQSVARGATGLVDGVRWLSTLRPALTAPEAEQIEMDETERRRWKVLDLPKRNYSGATPSITYRQGDSGVFTAGTLPTNDRRATKGRIDL